MWYGPHGRMWLHSDDWAKGCEMHDIQRQMCALASVQPSGRRGKGVSEKKLSQARLVLFFVLKMQPSSEKRLEWHPEGTKRPRGFVEGPNTGVALWEFGHWKSAVKKRPFLLARFSKAESSLSFCTQKHNTFAVESDKKTCQYSCCWKMLRCTICGHIPNFLVFSFFLYKFILPGT